jgi:inner membrane protein
MKADIPGFFERHRILIKGMIIGVLMLVMLIPTVFVFHLVNERKMRQQEIVREVSTKWASAQSLVGPFLYVPYTNQFKDSAGRIIESKSCFWILPEEVNVDGFVGHNIRKRSIYNVLLYTADLRHSGAFIIKTPSDINQELIQWRDAKLCFALSDFKGIRKKMVIMFNGRNYEMTPGLPNQLLTQKGLSVPVQLAATDTGRSISFAVESHLKGSENLGFLPLAGNSTYSLKSSWASPSFTGSSLPDYRKVGKDGFEAKWSFNKANLPFNTVLKDISAADIDLDFGVTLLQPTDQYVKTERSVKYAILFIGLTFGLFFVVEVTRKTPVHAVQYMLVGLALVIFYTLLLSISEFIQFDYAYLVSAVAIVSMLTLYSLQLFGSMKSAVLTGGVVALQYAFIFVLIRLEDTALLVGSIGLFIVLAIVMYASRKIDWYGNRQISYEEVRR